MELTYLIENYSYLKFIVDVYDEYSKKHEISDDIMFRKIKSKYEEAKTFLSFIETAITMLPTFASRRRRALFIKARCKN